MPALTAPAIHATDSDNQPSISAAVSVVTDLHVVAEAAGHRQKQRASRIPVLTNLVM